MLNPLTYTENVVRSFLRYQLTAYPFADPRLNKQMRELLSLDRTRQTLGYAETLRRGYAVVRAAGAVVTTRTAAEAHPVLEIEFADGSLAVETGGPAGPAPKPRRPKAEGGPDQGSLF